MRQSERAIVNDASQIASARRMVTDACHALKFSENDAGRAAVVATELASNLLKHANGGELILTRLSSDDGYAGLQLFSIDHGPGMRDPVRCCEDGFSTAGSAGNGLGAIQRMSDEFDLHSDLKGTVVQARIWTQKPSVQAGRPQLKVGAINLPLPGQEECGDGYSIRRFERNIRFLVIDGLGHGTHAAAAAQAGMVAFEKYATRDCNLLAGDIDASIAHTRGAAIAVVDVDFTRRDVTFVGVGNINGVLVNQNSQTRSMASMNGIAGSGRINARAFQYPWTDNQILILHSDGLTTHWKIDAYAGLAGRDPAVIAGVLFRDCNRGRDDATVVVATMWV